MTQGREPDGAHGQGGPNELVSTSRYDAAMPMDLPIERAHGAPRPGALPPTLYRRISLPAWTAVLVAGTACWALLFSLL